MPQEHRQLPFRLKPEIPEKAALLEEILYTPQIAYVSAYNCEDCEQTIPFEDELRVDWPTDGPIHYYFGPLPGYQCHDCDLIYLPTNVLEVITQIAGEDYVDALPQDTLQVPQNVRLAVGAFIDRQSPQ